MAELCNICANHYTEFKRKKICCPKCNEISCTDCNKHYIMNTKSIFGCMHCKEPWSREFIYKNFTKTFLTKDYKTHRELILSEQADAKSLMYQNMIYERQLSKDYKECTDLFNNTVYIRRNMLSNFAPYKKYGIEIQNIMDNIQTTIDEISANIAKLQHELRQHKLNTGQIKPGEDEEIETGDSVRGLCPKENCKGYILNSWKCALCPTKVCKSCLVDTTDNGPKNQHLCNQDDLVSIQAIRKDSKLCPGCKIRIYRTEGCPQMFCTGCKIFFDWNTLKLITNGRAHNPHFTEYLATTGQTRDQALNNNIGMCGITENIINLKKGEKEGSFLRSCIRKANEFKDYSDNRIIHDEHTYTMQNEQICIQFITEVISKKTRNSEMQKIDKKLSKLKDFNQAADFFADSILFIINSFAKNTIDLKKCLEDIENVIKYTRELYDVLSDIYGCIIPYQYDINVILLNLPIVE
jgi:hypothetical protein